MSVKLVAFREDTWFAPLAEYNLYNHLAIAYNCDSQLIRDWSEAVVPDGWPVILAYEHGELESRQFRHPENAVYVFGRTALDLLGAVPNPDVILRVDTPGSSLGMFGAQIAAIVLRDRQQQGW